MQSSEQLKPLKASIVPVPPRLGLDQLINLELMLEGRLFKQADLRNIYGRIEAEVLGSKVLKSILGMRSGRNFSVYHDVNPIGIPRMRSCIQNAIASVFKND